jgi:hypothetical protein
VAHPPLRFPLPPVCPLLLIPPRVLSCRYREIMFPFFGRPYMGSFSRARHSPVSLGMGVRCLSVNILSVAMWEFVRVLLEVYSTEVRQCSDLPANGTMMNGSFRVELANRHVKLRRRSKCDSFVRNHICGPLCSGMSHSSCVLRSYSD